MIFCVLRCDNFKCLNTLNEIWNSYTHLCVYFTRVKVIDQNYLERILFLFSCQPVYDCHFLMIFTREINSGVLMLIRWKTLRHSFSVAIKGPLHSSVKCKQLWSKWLYLLTLPYYSKAADCRLFSRLYSHWTVLYNFILNVYGEFFPVNSSVSCFYTLCLISSKHETQCINEWVVFSVGCLDTCILKYRAHLPSISEEKIKIKKRATSAWVTLRLMWLGVTWPGPEWRRVVVSAVILRRKGTEWVIEMGLAMNLFRILCLC